jgi:hypothetical protein
MNTTSSAVFRQPHTINARRAWALLAAGVLGYEVVCKDGELLSECVDQWLVSRPILTRAAIAALALHLGNAVPKRYDVVSLGFQAIRTSSRCCLHPRSTRRARSELLTHKCR